ncbi:MAG: 3-methyl-2-oxobutanoate hydroxymethyltransferase [Candidatus Synoicihabitans palmerolidicus]|nr:3-methyl-2-oxobutanoate hydroxymethyltransferase [Candidatus Synoicihabitans palmerolidicus]
MSESAKPTTHALRRRKGGAPIVAVTAYDAVMAHYAGLAGVDIILVGDSVGNTVLGLTGTVPVTLDMMVHHSAAVVRAQPPALVVADVPFGEAHFDFRRVLMSCQRLMQEAGVDAVKIEGGRTLAPKIVRLVEAGVPVWGHIGLMPQQVKQLGRYKKFGVTDAETAALVADAQALEAAGCFALLLEMVKPEAAAIVTKAVQIPVIGIGAGADCDGQILVFTDVLGITTGYVPGFVEKFAEVGALMKQGLTEYASAVKQRTFPKR